MRRLAWPEDGTLIARRCSVRFEHIGKRHGSARDGGFAPAPCSLGQTSLRLAARLLATHWRDPLRAESGRVARWADPPVFELEHYSKASCRRNHRGRSRVNGVDDLRTVDSLQVDRCDAEVRMPELALDNDQRHALMRHLDRVRVTELM